MDGPDWPSGSRELTPERLSSTKNITGRELSRIFDTVAASHH